MDHFTCELIKKARVNTFSSWQYAMYQAIVCFNLPTA